MKGVAKMDNKREKTGFEYPSDAAIHTPEWIEHLKTRYHGSSRPCRHAITGRIDPPKLCAFNYECFHCAFDQMLDEPVWTNMVLFNSPQVSAAM